MKLGKIGKINIKANKFLSAMWLDMDVNYCEVKLGNCIGARMGLMNCHRHERIWYKENKCSRLVMLWDYKQVLRGCPACHENLDRDKTLRERIFMTRRGREVL